MKRLLICFVLSAAFVSCGIKPSALRCENLADPSSIDTEHPALSWICKGGPLSRNQRQSAYRICASSTKELLDEGYFDLWDSGKTISDRSIFNVYDGVSPEEGSLCWWKVMVWDKNGRRSPWSEPSCWRKGMDDGGDYKDNWIGADWQHGTAPEFMKSFTVEKKVSEAVAFVSALGFYELSINGARVGDDYLAPNISNATDRPQLKEGFIAIDDNFTDYRVYYLAYDITKMLQNGENSISALLGEGFYNAESHWVCPFGQNALFCRLLIRYEDGTSENILTDSSWGVRESSIRMNGVYSGELYDGAYIPGEWKPVSIMEAPHGRLCAQAMHSDRIMESVKPVLIAADGDSTFTVDFGKEISGWIRFNGICGARGDTLKVDYICESPQGAQRYIFGGGGPESYAPRFTWFVFRKARISGIGRLEAKNIFAEFVRSEVETNSVFSCSDTLFNHINEIWRLSQMDNMHVGVASDCPHRERSPYTGDGQVSCVTVMHNFDAAAFYRKWIRDILDTQNASTGYVPNSAPWQPASGGGVPWGAAVNIMPWEFYLHYGDIRMLEEAYGGMRSHLEWMCGWITPEGTMLSEAKTLRSPFNDKWLNLGDWAPAFSLPDKEIVHTFFLWRCADYTSKAAAILGFTEDAKCFGALADTTAAAFDRKFYNGDKHSYGDFGANVFALAMGVPESREKDVVATLKTEIGDTFKAHLNTGIFGTQFLFETLAKHGLNDLACKVMSQTDFPGFGNWISQGATTTWEQWNGKDSRNHPMFGGGLTWFYRCLAGLETDPLEPAYKHMIVKPVLSPLAAVSYSTETPYGTAAVTVSTGRRKKLSVKVPVGCHASVSLPWNGQMMEIGQGTYRFREK